MEVSNIRHFRSWIRCSQLSHYNSCRAPVLIIAKNKGRELRFIKVSQLRLMREPAEMREFLLREEWRETPPWSGPWSPRGSRYVVSTFLRTYLVPFVPTTLTAWFSFNRFSSHATQRNAHET